ncbi:MAG: glucosaminidase domain-containing protein [Phycisphaerae bacterium]|nr:glucosaminidase domain-containing protein [Saprospiraceae bacterium]
MGKNKWYFETENSTKQTGSASSNSSQGRSKKISYMPSTFISESPENMPLPKLMRLVWLRLRRSWVALRFQANRWSFGIFRRKTVVQLCILAGTGFLLLGPDGESGLLTSGNATASNWARETTFDVGSEEKPTRKIKSPRTKNEAAPLAADELLREQSLDYIERYSKIAIGEMQQFGIPASISLAQGLIESRAGTSKLAVSNNNHFGMKCFSRHCKKGHCSNFTDDTHKDFFRKFPNAWESWRAHSQLLASGRYNKLKRHGRDYRAWAYGLKSVGYATDRTYAEKLIGIIDRYDLHKYDR